MGDWGTRISIFDAFIEELKTINSMSICIGRPKLFRETFSEDRPNEFGFLLRPTLGEFNAFVMLLDKMMSDNINREFFVGQISLEEDEERRDGKIVVKQKGTIKLLEDWVQRYFRSAEGEPIADMFKGFRAVRNLRQKPAHAVNENVFDLKYFKEQRRLVIDAYDSIRTLRLILANHPNVKRNPPNIEDHVQRGEIWDF